MAGDSSSAGIIDQLFSGLVELTPEMDVVPDLAHSWEVSEDGRRFTFHLRDNLHWSDGAPLTARDFEYAWKRALDPATRSPNASLLYEVKGARALHRGDLVDPDEVGVRALDDATLLVDLAEPSGCFLQLLTDLGTYAVPGHVVQSHGEAWTEVNNLVTSGPFRLEAWHRGETMSLLRNPEYQGRFTGNVQRVELYLFDELSAALAMYETDELDIVDLPPVEMDRARQRHAGEYFSVPRLVTHYVGFDVSRPPFDDLQVRRALAMATDRERLAHVVLRGYETPATGGFVPPGMPGHSTGIALPYDPERANQLLAQAGYPGGLGFPSLDLLTNSYREAQGQYLEAQWRQNLGLQVRCRVMEWAAFLDRLDRRPPRIFIGGWLADYPDPDSFMRTSPVRRYTRWRNEAYDGLVEKARRIVDQAERVKLYQQADRILVDEAPIIPLDHHQAHLLLKPWVSKYPLAAIGPPMWKNIVIEPH